MRLEHTPQQTGSTHEVSRNRCVTRVVRVYGCSGKFEPDWQGLAQQLWQHSGIQLVAER